jgi:RNase P subunit RPR2
MASRETPEMLRRTVAELRRSLDEEKRRSAQLHKEKVHCQLRDSVFPVLKTNMKREWCKCCSVLLLPACSMRLFDAGDRLKSCWR